MNTTRLQAFGESLDLTLVGVAPEQATRARAELAEDFAFRTRAWDPWVSGVLADLNRRLATGTPVTAPPSVLPLLRTGQRLAAQSEGLYNPALGRLITLWGFDRTPPYANPPTQGQLETLLTSTPRIDQVELDGIEIRVADPRIQLDFGRLAPALAIDLAIARLRELGIVNALIQRDGAWRASGDRGGQPWRVPILRAGGSGVLAIVALRRDEALGSVADHQRDFIHQSVIYHDVLDPRSGRPARDSRAVTVLLPDLATATVAARALFVAGPEHWLEVAQRMGVTEALLVDRSGEVHVTQALWNRLERVDPGARIHRVNPITTEAATIAP
ncbi:thiamine biosynthesis protein ApbE [Marichromatium purpuratum 984]|uniref:FAD:protein FMN transferase n=1 Tax=Marichromatium purpuratum 984 TaxID=765910 RepID=W0E7Z7_MARPU|nr:thiamine biosynthesis protein ApbE [Marichromatium purpuratum 984]